MPSMRNSRAQLNRFRYAEVAEGFQGAWKLFLRDHAHAKLTFQFAVRALSLLTYV